MQLKRAICPGREISAVLLALAMLAGCDDHRESKSAPPPAPAIVEHPGTISGRVSFSGTAPQLSPLSVSGDAHCKQLHPDGLPDESVVIASDGAVANAFVYLKDVPRSNGSARPAALIDQVGCRYVPHAVGVQIYQPLRVKSSDPVLHNVHVQATANPPLNLAETEPGEQTVKFESAEFMRTRCDVHPWMTAIIGVFDSPYFAVTGADGKFTIREVPPGSYTLAVWHERFAELTAKITVAPDGTVQQDFAYVK